MRCQGGGKAACSHDMPLLVLSSQFKAQNCLAAYLSIPVKVFTHSGLIQFCHVNSSFIGEFKEHNPIPCVKPLPPSLEWKDYLEASPMQNVVMVVLLLWVSSVSSAGGGKVDLCLIVHPRACL